MAMLLAAALPPAGETLPTCSLVTPRGDAIAFVIWGADNPDEIRLSGVGGTAWPARTLVAVRQAGSPQMRFVIGGRDGFILELGSASPGQQRPATLFGSDREYGPLPLAYGFCEERPVAGNLLEPGPEQHVVAADSPAFDPDQWPDDCALILSDGRRLRFSYTLVGDDQVRFASSDLWSAQQVTTTIRWINPIGQVGSFGRPGGPAGVQLFFVRGPDRLARGVKLIRLEQVGAPSPPSLTAYGICGYKQVVRRRAN